MVLSVLIVVTIMNQGSIIFLRLSENVTGQYDGVFFTGGERDYNVNNYQDKGKYLNFTQVQDLTAENPYNLSPRMNFCNSKFYLEDPTVPEEEEVDDDVPFWEQGRE